jgi:hypothetical protein
MLFTSLLLAAAASVPAFATPTPTTTAAPVIVTPLFCTDATYSSVGGGFPYGVPLGSGFCAGPAVTLGQCCKASSLIQLNLKSRQTLTRHLDDWTSFPTVETGPLAHNLSYAHIGNNFACNLYK